MDACRKKVGRERKKRKSYVLSSSSFAIQISLVHHIAMKKACWLIADLILVTRGTEKQTLLLAGYKHPTIVYCSLKEFFFVKLTVKRCFKTESIRIIS